MAHAGGDGGKCGAGADGNEEWVHAARGYGGNSRQRVHGLHDGRGGAADSCECSERAGNGDAGDRREYAAFRYSVQRTERTGNRGAYSWTGECFGGDECVDQSAAV